MKIDPKRLLYLRKNQNLSRAKLAEKSVLANSEKSKQSVAGKRGITERTIQRLEDTSRQDTVVRKYTLESLAKALGVKTGVLTGELPLPQSEKASTSEPERVQIGAQIAPKARLAYDLVRRRYDVSDTEIINMAPFFFALLAEGSLAWRRKKLRKAKKAISRLDNCGGHFAGSGAVAQNAYNLEDESVVEVDLFGEHLFFNDTHVTIVDEPFDPSVDNPFASYLRKLVEDLKSPGIVDVEDSDLWLKFPNYDICRDEIKRIANRSPDAKMALETGHARLSQIPDELMAEDAGEERAKWLKEKLPDIYAQDGGERLAEIVAKEPEGDLKKLFEERKNKRADSQKIDPADEEKGDDQ